jgi:hypothetical protein
MSSPYRDRDAFQAIVTSLAGTGEFASVVFGTPAELDAIGADRVPAAVVMPTSWDEVPDTAPSAVRKVAFAVTLVVRGESGAERFRLLERLTSVVQNAVDGSDLAGGCLPALTRVGKGRQELALKRLEGRAVLAGEFAYLVPDIKMRNVTP